jgi:DnaK suppressor protein
MQTTPTPRTARHAMPSHGHGPAMAEPMNSMLRHRLDDLERRLVDMSQTMDRLLRESPVSGNDNTEATTAVPGARPDQAVLSEVRAAQARLEAGSYGLCASCDAPIEHHRLAGRPQVQHCGFCEQQRRQHETQGVPCRL